MSFHLDASIASSLPSMTVPDDPSRLAAWRIIIETRLDELTRFVGQVPLQDAMRYSVLSPGKRLRPLLTLAVHDHFGGRSDVALDTGLAFEMVHAASLTIDDLPCMDDDAERRGQPTTHAKFGQDVAILAAIALLAQSYDLIANNTELSDASRLQLIRLLSATIGPLGLTRGQHADLHMHDTPCATNDTAPTGHDLRAMTDMHHRKTGVRFIAAAEAGAIMANTTAAEQATIRDYACSLGLAFQLMDDLSDSRKQETNLAREFGIAAAEKKLAEHVAAARRHVASLGRENSGLHEFTALFFAGKP